MDFKVITLSKLYEDCQKESQTYQPSKSPMFWSTEFLGRVHGDLEEYSLGQDKAISIISFFWKKTQGLLTLRLSC